MKLEENVGFFLSCYKEKEAVKFCFDNIRHYYKKNPIFISSDGGYEFGEICDNNSKFYLFDDVLGYVNNPESKDPEKLILCCREFLNRLKIAADYCNKDYIVYYEPDILLRGLISIDSELDINGSFANTIHQEVLSLILKYNPKNSNFNFGACGGSVIKVSSLMEVLKKTDDDLLREIICTDKRVSNCDYLLTVLFSIFNYRYLENTDFIEAKRNQDWENTQHSIVHQYHNNYQENYEGKYRNLK
jgi:hypothetical protein